METNDLTEQSTEPENTLENDTAPPLSQPPTTSKMDDFAVMQRIRKSKSGEKFTKLMDGDLTDYGGDRKRAVSALLCILSYWTQKNKTQMDRIFRSSKLMSDDWDDPDVDDAGVTVGEKAISDAVAFVDRVYLPLISLTRSADQLVVYTSAGEVSLSDLHPEEKRHGIYGWQDIGTSRLFADIYKWECRYVIERKRWYVYDGSVWRPDDEGAMERAKEFVEALVGYAKKLPLPADPEKDTTRADYLKYVGKLTSRRARETILKDASSVHPLRMCDFDKDPYTLNVQNGELDLKHFVLKEHRPESFLTKMANVHYDPNIRSALWESHMDAVTCGDMELRNYMQKGFGYGITGATNYECFFLLYGPTTRNGKSTTIDSILTMLGDYAKSGRPETLGQKASMGGDNPNESIARLSGARIVNFAEPDKKLRLSASLVKALTGNDVVTARFLHENSFSYKPTYKIFINANTLPATDDITLFRSGRVKVLPFNARFVGKNQDTGLKQKLQSPENLSGMLNFCIEGLKLLEATGFKEPKAVREATEIYERDSDKIGRFVEEMLSPDPQAELLTDDVYKIYQQWCMLSGTFAESKGNFKQGMEAHGIKIQRKRPADQSLGTNPRYMYIGYTWASANANSAPTD